MGKGKETIEFVVTFLKPRKNRAPRAERRVVRAATLDEAEARVLEQEPTAFNFWSRFA